MKQQKLQQAPANLILEGYDTYAVLKGGNNVIKFSDNTDITTDKNTSAIEVTPKGKANSEYASFKFDFTRDLTQTINLN